MMVAIVRDAMKRSTSFFRSVMVPCNNSSRSEATLISPPFYALFNVPFLLIILAQFAKMVKDEMYMRIRWSNPAKVASPLDFLAHSWYILSAEIGGADPLNRGWKSSALFFRSLMVSAFSPAISVKLEPL